MTDIAKKLQAALDAADTTGDGIADGLILVSSEEVREAIEALSRQPMIEDDELERVARAIAFAESKSVHPKHRRHARSALDAAQVPVLRARIEELIRERSFIWKWVERAIFDEELPASDCLDVLACYPGAPWNEGRWDVDHKPYAERFYERFPKARAALTKGSDHG